MRQELAGLVGDRRTVADSGLSPRPWTVLGGARDPRWSDPVSPRLAWVAFAGIAVLTCLFLLWVGHGLNFRHDEWDIIQGRYRAGASTFLLPLNEHLSAVLLGVYYVLLHTVGLAHYAPYRAVLIALNVACAGCVFVLVRARLNVPLALLAATVVLVFGAAYEDMLFPVQIGQVGSILGGLLAWISLDTSGRRGNLGLVGALALSVACSGLGLAVLAGVIVELAWRRDTGRMVWPGLIVCLYLVWYSQYGIGTTHTDLANAPGFFVGIVSYTVLGSLGLWPLYHLAQPAQDALTVILCVIAGLGSKRILRRHRDRPVGRRITPGDRNRNRPDVARILDLGSTALVFWVLTAVARGGLTPDRSRYTHLGGIVIVLIAAEMLRGWRMPRRYARLVAAAGAGFVLVNVPYIVHNAAKYRSDSAVLSAELTAMQLHSGPIAPAFQPDPAVDPQVKAGTYLRAVRALRSSPADSLAALAAAPPSARTAADSVSIRAEGHPVRLISSGEAARSCAAPGARRGLGGRGVAVARSGRAVVVNRSPEPIHIGARRFGPAPVWTTPAIPAGSSAAISLGPDTAGTPWVISTTASGATELCTAP
jgi:hypothetical protein